MLSNPSFSLPEFIQFTFWLHSWLASSLGICSHHEMSLGFQRKPQTTMNQLPCENPWQTPCRQQKSKLPSVVYRSSPVFYFQWQLRAIPIAGHAAPSPPLHGPQLCLWGFLQPCSFLAGHCSLRGQRTVALKEGFPPWSCFYWSSRFHFRDFKMTASSAKEDKKKQTAFWKLLVIQSYVALLHLLYISIYLLCPLQVKGEKGLIWEVHAKHVSFKQFAKPTEGFYSLEDKKILLS